MSTVPVVVTEPGRDCVHTVLEFYAGAQPTPTGRREGFVDCSNGCAGVIEPTAFTGV